MERPSGGTETILLADDDKNVLDATRYMLEMAGYKVLTAENGEEAICIYEEYSDEIDLVLLDMVMPKIGGKEAYDQIRKTHPDTLFLFASGYSTDALSTNIFQDKSLNLIQKPYHRDDLFRKLRELLDA